MRIRLSYYQWQSVSARLPELTVRRAVEHRVTATSKSHYYELPAIAWQQIVDILRAEAYGPRGGRREVLPASFYSAKARIEASVAMRLHHPALMKRVVQFAQDEVIPVWATDDGWTPVPPVGLRGVNASESDERTPSGFTVLLPHVRTHQGDIVTEWAPVRDGVYTGLYVDTHWLHREESHLEFVR